MRSRLASIMSLIQPILTPLQGVFASPVPTYPLQSAQPPRSAHSTHNVSTPGSVQSPGSAEESASWHTATGQAQPSPKPNHFKSLNQQRNELVHNLELGSGEQLKLDFLLDPSHRVNRIQTAVNGAQDSPSFQQLPLKHDWAATTYPPPRSSSVLSNSSQHHPHAQVTYMSQHMSHNPEASWAGSPAPIQNSEPTCPLDSLLLDFLHERRQRAAEGMPIQEIVGPRYPSISSLLNPSTGAHPLSKVFTDILATFPGICTLPERIAVLYVMFLIMRWQISPTRENYELLPPWARPLPSQLRSPHPAWVDHLPFPSLRDKIAREYNPGEYLFENFFIPFTSTISLNWPYEPTDALLETPDGSELLINPVFERHLRRLENWTLGDAFDKAFPMLRGTYNYKADGSAGGSRSGSRGGSTAGGQSADDEIHGR
ncbi:BZIP transcription factor [Xylariomycetidae sp. FL2044]|nr:BZIP transcription factor [Xylariomycetidae sp. FL2044]